ncbi:unnamed protein product [Vicia faba]|uniref:Sorting nexin-16 n=1 Tax=Vicia faba TaxID=3906 RepID=A0AAV1B9N5_VICFA|nr:unnamed protein product [Vicia faba]
MKKKPMESVNDLIQELKLRTLWWFISIFAVSYFLTNTSKSMWMNVPMSILFVCALRVLVNNAEFRWKVPQPRSHTYLSHLEKKQLLLNDPRLSSAPSPVKWKRKIDSPVVEEAMGDFIDKILKDFVVDLWYSEITPDREFPDQIHAIIMDVLAEISARVKEINLVDLLTRDLVDLIGEHLELFRRNQAAIGVDVMKTLSSEERDDRLKFHLLNSKELHPALISPESEYKVLQRLMSALLATVLRQREAHCPVIRSIARELMTCLVMQPIMNLASPVFINELIESLLLLLNDDGKKWTGGDQSTNVASHGHGRSVATGGGHDNLTASSKHPSLNPETGMTLAKMSDRGETSLQYNPLHQESSQAKPADWARMLEVATQRRTEILMPENLENMWAKGRNYKRKENKIVKPGSKNLPTKSPATDSSLPNIKMAQETLVSKRGKYEIAEVKSSLPSTHNLALDTVQNVARTNRSETSPNPDKKLPFDGQLSVDNVNGTKDVASDGYKSSLKRSSSASALGIQPNQESSSIISEFYNPEFERHNERFRGKSSSDMIIRKEGQLAPKLRCRVMGAYFEKIGATSFAVYSIAVTDAQDRTWFVKRRYRNFERLHRHLKDIPNYTLHLPPKRIFSSSTDDAFVHQRCIQLDKYLQDLLSIANVAEQHEVWDFFSVSSKNYSFGKSSSVIKTLAVNVDDAVDDIVRQFKGVSDGLRRKMNWIKVPHSEVPQKGHPPLSTDHTDESSNLDFDRKRDLSVEARVSNDVPAANLVLTRNNLEDPVVVPPEWSPSNVSVPLLNLVDTIFKLKKRGWIRRQVFWMSKQILQLVMEDAIDDWLLRQIHLLRKEDTVAQGIRWLQDFLWPGGTFFLRIGTLQTTNGSSDQKPSQTISGSEVRNITKHESGSFEQQLEAARRESDIKKLLFDGAPTTLVSLIGHKQYRRCARDIYYFSQSTVCVKQLAYAILELLLVSVFPEMRNVVLSVHENVDVHRAS